jgi:hypothetical protein
MKFRTFSDIALCCLVGVDRRVRGADCRKHQEDIIALTREAVRTSETSVYSNETTQRYNPEGPNIHTRRRESLQSDKKYLYL